MAITDYNKKKKLDVTSVSGTPTVGKAQPFIIKGGLKEYDGFEDGDYTSSPSWTESVSNGSATVQTGTVKNGSNALELSNGNSGDELLSHDRGTSDTVSDGDVYRCWINSGDVQEETGYELSTSSSDIFAAHNLIIRIRGGSFDVFVRNSAGDGNVGSNEGFLSASSNTWYLLEIEVVPSNSRVYFRVYDSSKSLLATVESDTTGRSEFQYTNTYVRHVTSSSVSAYFDDVSYGTGEVSESETGNGYIWIPFDNISDAQDLAVYDQNDNLLDYEVEDLDTTRRKAVLWGYNSWVRDDSTQAQIVYGNNSANTDRQNVTGTWDNTGQNAEMVQHLQDDPLTATDSTSNNNDGSVTGATSTSGEFDGAASFDGTDDYIDFGDVYAPTGDDSYTILVWGEFKSTGNSGNIFSASNQEDDGFAHFIRSESSNSVTLSHGGSDSSTNKITTSINENEQYLFVLSYDGSSNNIEAFLDSTSLGTDSDSGYKETTNAWFGGTNAWDLSEDFNGVGDEYKIYSKSVVGDSDWVQAEYDASPKAGQVFFSQQAAESTVNTKTTTVDYDTAIQDKGLTTTVDYDAAIQDTLTVTPDYDLALQQQGKTQTVDYDTAIQTTGITINVDYNAAVGYRINGYVKVEGSRTQGVDVMIYNLTTKTHIGHTTTDSNGDYEISDVDNISSGDKISVAVDYYDSNDDTYYGSEQTTVV